jgi:hypothetical protein
MEEVQKLLHFKLKLKPEIPVKSRKLQMKCQKFWKIGKPKHSQPVGILFNIGLRSYTHKDTLKIHGV